MAERVTVECRQCGEDETFEIEQFIGFVREEDHTRINLKDSGSLNLSLHICPDCLDAENEEAATRAPRTGGDDGE
jgi:hypothetical protein